MSPEPGPRVDVAALAALPPDAFALRDLGGGLSPGGGERLDLLAIDGQSIGSWRPHPEVKPDSEALDKAANTLARLYLLNVYPAQNLGWNQHHSNTGHTLLHAGAEVGELAL